MTSVRRSSASSPTCPAPHRRASTFSATIDSRYSTSPTLLKLIAMIVGVALTVLALVALHVLDTADGMRHRRFLPPRWWSMSAARRRGGRRCWCGGTSSAPTPPTTATSSTMARVSEHAGYMANYYRWFGVPEAPFGWYYDLLALWAHVSTASLWMRLPALLIGAGLAGG